MEKVRFHNPKGYIKIGLIANIMFVLFIIICMVYYKIFSKTDQPNYFIETIAYLLESFGFVFMLGSFVGFISILRDCRLLKVSTCIYFAVELVMIILDFNIFDVSQFYNPCSKALVIGHCIFSAFVCMTFMDLDKKNTKLQLIVAIASGIILLGVFAIAYNVRVYASILINSFAYIFLYSSLLHLIKMEDIEFNCHGDNAKVTVYKSSFFDEKK